MALESLYRAVNKGDINMGQKAVATNVELKILRAIWEVAQILTLSDQFRQIP